MKRDAQSNEDSLKVVTESREFRRCTSSQKVFVLKFLQSGDAARAIAKAYPSATAASRRAMQWQVLRASAVVDVLEVWAWRDTKNARAHLIKIIREQLKAAAPGSVAAGRFAVQLERLILGVQGTNKAHFVDPDEPDAPDELGEPQAPAAAGKTGTADKRIPDGATPLVDAAGIVRGYKTEAGDYVQLSEVEVSK